MLVGVTDRRDMAAAAAAVALTAPVAAGCDDSGGRGDRSDIEMSSPHTGKKGGTEQVRGNRNTHKNTKYEERRAERGNKNTIPAKAD